MTRPSDCTLTPELVELLTEQGLEALPEVLRIILNAAMAAERERHLQAAPYERTPERQGRYHPVSALSDRPRDHRHLDESLFKLFRG